MAACADQAVELPRAELVEFIRFDVPPVARLATFATNATNATNATKLSFAGDLEAEPGDGSPARDTATNAIPYVCERFELRAGERGRVWHKRLRRSWDAEDRERFHDLVSMVAEELGADPKLLTLWALRESTYNPYAIHVLDPDVDASIASWRRHRWDPDRAAELDALMTELGARDPGYWAAKAELARISRFRANPHYDTQIDYERVAQNGERSPGRRSAWSYGYGPFGFNPTYFLPTWDATAPPWVFCNDDGLAAIVTAVWAAREHQSECVALDYAPSNEVVNRRFSSGHCEPRPGRADKFRTRARARGINPDARARLGDRWPAATTDRAELLDHLRELGRERGLLSSYASPTPTH